MKKKHKFYIQNKHLIVIMTMFCFSLMLMAARLSMPIQQLRNAAGYIIVPFQKGINNIGSWVLEQTKGLGDARALAQENEELKEKIAKLTEQNTAMVQDKDELIRLQELYKLDKDYSEYEKVAAQIISCDPGNWYNTFTINRGSNDGIQVDMNVLGDGGLVGIVYEVGKDWASVRSLIDDSSNVSAMAAGSGSHCIVTGDLRKMDEGKLQFIQMSDPQNQLREGEKIVTSNISEKFLRGILIGYVSEIQEDSNHLTKSGTIVPVVDFQHLQEVLVVKQLKTTKEE